MNFMPKTSVTQLNRMMRSGRLQDWNNSWRSFFDNYYAALHKVAACEFARCGWQRVDEHVLDEVVRDVVNTLFRKRSSFCYDSNKGTFRGYLRRVVRYRALDQMRKLAMTNKEMPIEPDGETTTNNKNTSIPSEEIEHKERVAGRNALLRTMLDDIRRKVSPRTLLAFEKVKIMGESPEQVAIELGITRGTIDQAVHRVLKKLKGLATNEEYRKEYHD